MSTSKFIERMKELFGIFPETEEHKKKKTIKELILKLKLRRIQLKKELRNETNLLKRESLKENIQIIKQQIKKGKKILDH